MRLVRRLDENEEFLHEIGLFLGYPPEDVRGFIENKAAGYKYVGDWKVYGDEEKARKTFAKYKKCTRVYCAQFALGKSIERLTVMVTILMTIGFIMMNKVIVGRIVLCCVWVFHIIYFAFVVKTIKPNDNIGKER